MEFDADVRLYSVGIHPWQVCGDMDNELKVLESKLLFSGCVAVGECGLDKKANIPIEQQLPVFEAQLRLAQQYQKPVIVHCVAAFQELIEVKQRLKIAVPMIVHGFSKKTELAQQLLNGGFYLSFGKQLLHREDYGKILNQIPDDRFFLETDGHEAGIEEVFRIAAKHKRTTVEQLAQITSDNTRRVFNIN
jgi:TatD DNase family protein